MEEETITLKERLKVMQLKFNYGRFDQCNIGHLLIGTWQRLHPGVKPAKVMQEEDGEEFLVYSYPVSFIPEMDKVIAQYFSEKWERIKHGRQAALKAKSGQEQIEQAANVLAAAKSATESLQVASTQAASVEVEPVLSQQEVVCDHTASVQAEVGSEESPVPGKRPRIKKAVYKSGSD